MSILSHRLRRTIIAVPSYFQRSFSLFRTTNFPSVSSLLPQSIARQPIEFSQPPAKLFSTTQYQYDPYSGKDSFTPDTEGCDFNHWLITMNFPKDNLPSREEMISIFEQTCAKGLEISLEEAKKKIYAVCTTSYKGFQARMTIGEVEKFRDLPGVQYIIPDSYVDVEKRLYGGDKYENGVITPGPIPVPTREGFDSLAKESSSGQEQGLTSGLVNGQVSQKPLDQRSFKQRQGALALRQGQGQGSLMQVLEQGQGNQILTSRKGQSHDQGTSRVGQRQAQGSQIPSFHGRYQRGQETPSVGQGQGQESLPSVQQGYNQGQGTPVHGQGQGSQLPSYQMSYSQNQGARTPPWQGLPSSSGQGSLANYNQGPSPDNFIQGTQEKYNQMGQGSYIPQSGRNCGPPQRAESPGFRHGQVPGGQLLSSNQESYNQGQGTPMPRPGKEHQIRSDHMSYRQGRETSVPPNQGNYIQGTPNSNNQWAFTNDNQGPPQSNFHQGSQQNYNQRDQWSFSPQTGGNFSPPQFQHIQYHSQGNQMPRHQLSYHQGASFIGQWQCQGCGMLYQGCYNPVQWQGQGSAMPLYQGSYNQSQGTPNPGQWQGRGNAPPSYHPNYSHMPSPFQGNYNHEIQSSYSQGTSANLNRGVPVPYNQMGQGNYNVQSGGNYVESVSNPGFGQWQNQTFQQDDQRHLSGEWRSNNPIESTETGKIPHWIRPDQRKNE